MSVEPTKDTPLRSAQPRQAAVLLMVKSRGPQGEPYLVYIRRTEQVHTHKGQVSFPGGGFQLEDEKLENTALRETHEELGIHPSQLQLIGSLAPVDTVVSNFLIHPFIAIPRDPTENLIYIPDSFEVAAVLAIPLRHLIDPRTRRYEEWVMQGHPRQVVFFNYQQTIIWGATAFITHNFVNEIQAGKWNKLFP
jgi:8-oxo-dGTP pyrophosphatase MutT (NUDIX family)